MIQEEPLQLQTMKSSMRPFFAFFFVSGFCSILYELIWLRLAMAQFAVTTALVSIVLSAFMIGLGLGSWGAGRYVRSRSASAMALQLYSLTELLVGISAILVRHELFWGRLLLEKPNAGSSFSLPGYYVAAGILVGLILVPWCACMGATFPFAMAAIKPRSSSEESKSSFSYLYLANVLGAVTGTIVPLLFIEEWGFRGSLHVGAALNVALAASAFLLSLRQGNAAQSGEKQSTEAIPLPKIATRWAYFLLFATGLTSMGVELVWIRLFTPILGTLVYAFAAILCLYLGATYLGSWWYRRRKPAESAPSSLMLASLGFYVVLPFLVCDPRLHIYAPLRLLSIIPFSHLVGFITPMVLDRFSQGDPDRAGQGYAVNIAGCVLGPLVSGFLLLPWLGEQFTLLLYTIPWIVVSFRGAKYLSASGGQRSRFGFSWEPAAVGIVSLVLLAGSEDYTSQFFPREVRRDSTATVTAIGSVRQDKRLLVNGVGMTNLVPITKMIAHLPLAFLPRPPKDALVICFGMGTTHRSMLSWGINSTAVELVPSVVKVFPFFFSDAAQILSSPRSHIVIDDGRFYLERSSQDFDVIVLDPPPPVQAAASSLLYSTEFYAVAREHLRAGGILQQWYPGNPDRAIVASIAKSLRESFPYVRAFGSGEGFGYHFLASMSPIPALSAATLASHLPPTAVADLLEWGPESTAQAQFARVLNAEVSLDSLIRPAASTPALQDDRPVNEYFLLRYVSRPDFKEEIEAYFSHGRE